MRMQMTSQIDAGGNDPIFLMFHGYGNDDTNSPKPVLSHAIHAR